MTKDVQAAEAAETDAETVETQESAIETQAPVTPAGTAAAPESNTEAQPSGKAKTIASGADTEADDKAAEEAAAKAAAQKVDPNQLTDELRKMIAEHYAAGDKKLEAKELKRLERIKDIKSLWGMYREMESKFTSGGLIKKPGKDAKPEEVAEFQKALGWAEKPEDMLKEIKLENDAVIGEADKPALGAFLAAVHGATSAQEFVSRAANWYYKTQEEAAARLDEADDAARRESEKLLKEEFGPAYSRRTNAIAALFATAPGGPDANNPASLYHRLVFGRTADGRLIGNDPDVVRFLVSLVDEINPAATVTEDGDMSGKSVEAELAELRALRKTDPKKYWSEAVQRRELELIAVRDKIRERARP